MNEEIILTEENDIEEINIEEENYSEKPYVLPIASETTLGGIKVGNNLTIDADGTLNAVAGSNSEGISVETDPIFSASASANITNEDISNWNNKSEFSGSYNDLTNKPIIPSVPTNVSSFTNDAGYLIEVPSEYVTETELNAKGYLTSIPSTYKTKTENDALYQTKGNYLTSIPSEYVTETELNDAISNLGGGTGNVSSDIINSIVVVDSLPAVEEEGVLYLVKETPAVINLYYQDTEKNYASSSGISYTFGIDKTITLNGTPNANASTFSNNFTANLSTSKTYKLSLTYDSGDVAVNNSFVYGIYVYSGGTHAGNEILLQLESNDKNGVNGTFTPTIDGEYDYGLRIYVYKNNVYDNLKLNVLLEEV